MDLSPLAICLVISSISMGSVSMDSASSDRLKSYMLAANSFFCESSLAFKAFSLDTYLAAFFWLV